MSWEIAAALSPAIGQVWGALENSKAIKQANRENREMQYDFARNGIQMKVADAKKAGINPALALGATTYQASPSTIADTSMGDAMASMGQDIGRAFSATQTSQQKQITAMQIASAKLDIEGKSLENAIKAQQLNQLQSGPSFPSGNDGNFIPGQGNSPVQPKPATPVMSQPGRPAQEAGWVPDVGYSRTDSGLTPVVPSSLSESLEDDIIGKFFWRLRNQALPNLSGEGSPPKSQLPKGADYWKWSYSRQEWQPAKYEGFMRDQKDYFIEPKIKSTPWTEFNRRK